MALGYNIKKQENPSLGKNFQFLSKTVEKEDKTIFQGLSVETHCKIVGLVAKEIIALLPDQIAATLLPKGTELIAACHDIGKISPDFQRMIHENITDFNISDFPELQIGSVARAKRQESGFHAKVSQIVLSGVLSRNNKYIADIVGKHHGSKPNNSPLTEDAEIYGGKEWTAKRHELLNTLESFFTGKTLPHISSFEQANVIAGLVTVADWIGSGGDFASMEYADSIDDSELRQKAKEAVLDAGFLFPKIEQNLDFSNIFSFPPRQIQTKFIDSISCAGVYILEAPMGLGKTEAALYAAYKLLEQKKATGIYFALPTQLTSEKIHERVNVFLKYICHKDENNISAKLLHSSAWLTEKVFGEDGDIGGSWFDTAKRGILAPFAVGTVDQALMAVMNVKHGFVRTFGLAGKVVILDEVHSYDTYTGTILNKLVLCLRKIGCTVIILSATLTEAQKRELLALKNDVNLSDKYPLITSLPGSTTEPIETTSETERKQTVEIVHKNNKSEVCEVIDIVLEKAEQGEQVLWIENTVADAQNIYLQLSSRADSKKTECGLLHSRFTKKERYNKEDYWVSMYGKDAEKRGEKGRILVGTQVLEQSIDIDADFLVTQICPTDMLLQRMGRLWRHESNNSIRPPSAKCQTIILAPEYNCVLEKKESFDSSSIIYSEYVLCRTLEIWEKLNKVVLPNNIRNLLEETYIDRIEKGELKRLKSELEKKKEKLENLALIGTSTEIQTLPESKAQTRYSELETIDVLLCRSFTPTKEGVSLIFCDDTKLLIPQRYVNKLEKRIIAAKILKNTVRVSDYIAPIYESSVKKLKPFVYVGDDNDSEQPFRVVIVDRGDEIKLCSGSEANKKFNLWYNSTIGYKSEKKGGEY